MQMPYGITYTQTLHWANERTFLMIHLLPKDFYKANPVIQLAKITVDTFSAGINSQNL